MIPVLRPFFIMKTKQIQFHNDTIIAFQDEAEKWWVAVKPIADAIGLYAESAVRSIKNHPILGAEQCVRAVQLGKNQTREYVCLPTQHIQGWLFSIDSSKVKAEAREKLITYQRECFQVLHDHFMGKTAQVVKNQKRRCELLRERDYLKKSMFEMKDKIKMIDEELHEIDTDTFIQLDLFSAPIQYELED
jgi:hypothetical protein